MGVITQYWKRYQEYNTDSKNVAEPPAFYFCDNKIDADECAELVAKGIKRATSPSVWWFKKHGQEFPKIGNLAIITNWQGSPMAIIRTTKVAIVTYNNITPDYAFIEGEGDKSLNHWKTVHWEYYKKEMAVFGEYPAENMEILCEYFECIWT